MGVASSHCRIGFHPEKHPCAGIWPGTLVVLAPVWPILTLKMSSEVSLRTDPLRTWRTPAKDHPQVWWRATPHSSRHFQNSVLDAGGMGGSLLPLASPLKDGPGTSLPLLFLQGLETRHGWIPRGGGWITPGGGEARHTPAAGTQLPPGTEQRISLKFLSGEPAVF